MKVAVNGKAFGRRQKGGAARVAVEIVRELARARPDFEIDVLVPYGSAQLCLPELPARVRVRKFASVLYKSGLGRSAWEQFVLPRAVRTSRYDVLFNPTNSAPVLVQSGTRQLLLVHDAGFLNRSWYSTAYSRYAELVVRRAASRGALVVTVSNASAADLRAAIPGLRRIEVIHNDADHPPPDIPHIEVPQPFVLFLGSLNPRKNLAGAIAGFRLFARHAEVPFHFLVVGGSQPIFRRTGFGRGISAPVEGDRVQFIGYVSDAERWAYLRAARVLLIPSHLEGFGLPILEALRTGTPIVASDLPVIQELYGEAVERVDPTSPESIAAGLARMCFDEAKREERRTIGTRLAERYSWEESARRYAMLLEEVAEFA